MNTPKPIAGIVHIALNGADQGPLDQAVLGGLAFLPGVGRLVVQGAGAVPMFDASDWSDPVDLDPLGPEQAQALMNPDGFVDFLVHVSESDYEDALAEEAGAEFQLVHDKALAFGRCVTGSIERAMSTPKGTLFLYRASVPDSLAEEEGSPQDLASEPSTQVEGPSEQEAQEPVESPYPEHDRLRAVAEESQVIGSFLEDNGLGLMLGEHVTPEGWSNPQFVPVSRSIDRVLAEYFGIDLDKIEAEKRLMLERIREANG